MQDLETWKVQLLSVDLDDNDWVVYGHEDIGDIQLAISDTINSNNKSILVGLKNHFPKYETKLSDRMFVDFDDGVIYVSEPSGKPYMTLVKFPRK